MLPGGLTEYAELERRIGSAEEDAIVARWEFGRMLLAERERSVVRVCRAARLRRYLMPTAKANTPGATANIATVTPGAISTAAGCDAAYFHARPEPGLGDERERHRLREVCKFQLTFADDGALDQNGCSGASLSVPFSIP